MFATTSTHHDPNLLVSLTALLVLGIGAQWLSWRLRLPSILLLLLSGFLAGPIFGIVQPDQMFHDLLFPIVSLSVAIILFEGGLTLQISELNEIGRPLLNLLTIGVVLTWAMTSFFAVWILKMDIAIALLLGAILVVTGPTVVGPLLSFVRPKGNVASIARWEGIVIDPIGATLALLMFEVFKVLDMEGSALTEGLRVISMTVIIGAVLGILGAAILVVLLKNYWVPDALENPVVLMLVTAVFTLSNQVQEESGLLTVTIMGIAMANQTFVRIRHIVVFKENITVILLGSLFILLAARMDREAIANITPWTFLFVGMLILVVRPLSVFVSTIGCGMAWNERVFLAWLAPRGIVAAAVASIFAISLENKELVPAVFVVIVVTVAVYGLTCMPLARWLKLASVSPNGILIASAHAGARAIAHGLKSLDVTTLLVDTNRGNVQTARLEGLNAHYGNILNSELLEELDLSEVGRFVALTPNDEVNSMACMEMSDIFGKKNVFQLALKQKKTAKTQGVQEQLHGRVAFYGNATYEYLDSLFESGYQVKKTKLSKEFDYKQFQEYYEGKALPLFLIDTTGKIRVIAVDNEFQFQNGQTIISLVPANSVDKTEEIKETVNNDQG